MGPTKMFDILEDIDIQMKIIQFQAIFKIQRIRITNGIVGQYMFGGTMKLFSALIMVLLLQGIGIAEGQVAANPEFDFHSIANESKKELTVVSCGNFVYFPFGKLNSVADLSSSALKGFIVTPDRKRDGITLYSLQSGVNHLTLVFHNPDDEGPINSYLVNGEVNDSTLRFSNGLHVGMKQSDFFSLFFESYPVSKWKSLETVIFESCVTGTQHIYSFSKGRLKRIKFECVDCEFK